jgi:hypothetical protein
MSSIPETILDVDHKRYAKPATNNKKGLQYVFRIVCRAVLLGDCCGRAVNDGHRGCTTLAHVSRSHEALSD